MELFSDMEHRAVFLRQLSFLFVTVCWQHYVTYATEDIE